MVNRATKVGVGALVAYQAYKWVSYVMNPEHSLSKEAVSDRKKRDREVEHKVTGMSYFLNPDGLFIYWRKWEPIMMQPKGIVIISHGLGEHCSRYEHVAKALNEFGLTVYALDHQGHGQSEGDRVYVYDFEDFPTDVLQLTQIAQKEHPDLVSTTFLIGHSMGALIAIRTAIKEPNIFKGVVLSAPPLKIDEATAPEWQRNALSLIAQTFPKLPAPNIPLDTLSTDKRIVDLYVNDPLVNHGLLTARIVNEIFRTILRTQEEAGTKVTWPYLLMHGTGDKLCMPEGSRDFFKMTQNTGSTDKTFKEYEGSYHELFNEPDHDENALKDAVEWIRAKL
mmetsp:Transcript_31170/g.38500  ORF Transcript_31170/g.38500 Transcript_31170/m.38500 type:complete len:336 (+) Transcript_31170:115-1122(+)|eukprot:CAMPEP_0204833190 /NCGR_PEP_ID=MMETSP1346-20131115/15951_1 /ASSEMBLY_ACC=CAM_ASM_000771 /TAXON_ID=215587 /ORGANISM="Aplanochytrium stocchinoi, Strain GSBS06" /LENGTH=335 /DNA_ID=CAMNT_0051965513 /DNA_START=52 /DNA_END=1059 /DNA_ORIENTATION=+